MPSESIHKSDWVFFLREFLRINDECADKIYDIRDQSDMNREFLLNSDGVAPRFYQMEADAVCQSLKNK